MSFVVFALPRSRTAWLSVFLSAPGRVVGHDIGATCAQPSEFIHRLRLELAGTCETGAAFAWPLIRKLVPEATFVTVRRPVDEVIASLARFGLTDLDQDLRDRDAQLDEIERQPGTMRVNYKDLARHSVCEAVHERCTGRHMDGAWWAAMDRLNVQVDMRRQLALLARNAPTIAALKAQALEMMADA